MTITNPNGKIYPSIEEARLGFCPSRAAGDVMCYDCPLSWYNNQHKIDCPDLCRFFPDEAAELMGYTVEFCDPEFEKLKVDVAKLERELKRAVFELTERLELAVTQAAKMFNHHITRRSPNENRKPNR